ncbi:hypothetical protein B0F90DRAFT_1821229 [Multifurca ochricompacta]|uniref:NAD(P)-binding protein n=1 Tax=Multifurca ochricompacta TaxID=376703 RepID=A0AAD4LZX2_9AGAM|nr:hypothetical protein B0F90DRAFT_1821229 [Multifurca ochricompacta]
MKTFDDTRVWFITGANSGLGLALLKSVLASGERAIAAVRKPNTLSDLIQDHPRTQLLVQQLDVTDASQIAEAFRAAEKHFHRLDVVVNNAGYAIVGEIEAIPEDEARLEIETLFWGPVHITKQAIRFFREVNPPGHGGRILNVTSIGGYSGSAALAYYTAGKFALEGFTDAFVREMPPEWNIKGVVVEPGGFDTNWASASTIVPPHPAYNTETSPSGQSRTLLQTCPRIGDINRAARAMIRIASEPDPPLRLTLGSDAWAIVESAAKRTLREAGKWKELSLSTDLDGVPSDYMEKLQMLL